MSSSSNESTSPVTYPYYNYNQAYESPAISNNSPGYDSQSSNNTDVSATSSGYSTASTTPYYSASAYPYYSNAYSYYNNYNTSYGVYNYAQYQSTPVTETSNLLVPSQLETTQDYFSTKATKRNIYKELGK